MLTCFHRLSTHRAAPRLWTEGDLLRNKGFAPRTPFSAVPYGPGVLIQPSPTGDRLVSSRQGAGKTRIPIIDINNADLLQAFRDIDCARWDITFNRIVIRPSNRSAAILRALQGRPTYRIFEVGPGGGTLTDAATQNPRFEVVGAAEISHEYAAEYGRKHPKAHILQGDFRAMDTTEVPTFDLLVAGIPCTEHSAQGRAKKALAGIPELGAVGDLYIPILGLIATRMPLAVILENVPNYGASLAGRTIVEHLKRLGYSVDVAAADPNADYNEPTTRTRWICIATLKPGFRIPNPHQPFQGRIADYLDAPDAVQDQRDAARISKTIESLRRHNARHKALGHRFALTILDGTERSCPTITKSYSKLNSSGAYIATPWGPRALRPHEVCRLNGHSFQTDQKRLIYEMSGQGVLTRMFIPIFNALAAFLP